MKKTHLSEIEIQRLVETAPEKRGEDEEVFSHLNSCHLCRERFREMELIHRSLSEQDIEAADEVLVERVMSRVRSGRKESVLIPIVQRFAYVFAMLLVLGITGLLFYQFNIIDFTELRTPAVEATGIVWEYYKAMQEQGALFREIVIDTYDRYFDIGTFPIITFTLLLLLFLAVIDRLFLAPMLRRGR